MCCRGGIKKGMKTKEKDKSVWLLSFCVLFMGVAALLLFVSVACQLAPVIFFVITEGAPNLAGAMAFTILIVAVSVLCGDIWVHKMIKQSMILIFLGAISAVARRK